jgi:hypothetical protein
MLEETHSDGHFEVVRGRRHPCSQMTREGGALHSKLMPIHRSTPTGSSLIAHRRASFARLYYSAICGSTSTPSSSASKTKQVADAVHRLRNRTRGGSHGKALRLRIARYRETQLINYDTRAALRPIASELVKSIETANWCTHSCFAQDSSVRRACSYSKFQAWWRTLTVSGSSA